jgi:predicted TIM-barrel fold metal-dependent hydrolase
MWRIEHRLNTMGDRIKTMKPLREYLQANLYVTTSGNFHTPALNNALTELGVDHVLFSSNYPYESMRVAAEWFDNADISENDRLKVGRTNAMDLFPNLPEKIGNPAELPCGPERYAAAGGEPSSAGSPPAALFLFGMTAM